MKTLTILDGGMGRELKEIGAPFSQPLWSAQALIEAPDFVSQAHQNFVDAGAEIIITNSYACVPFHLGEELFAQRGFELAALSGELARAVADQAPQAVKVAGSIPPPFGSYRPDLFKVEQAASIIQTLYDAQEPNIDLWLVETLCSIQEFESIHTVLKQSTKPCYYAFSLEDTKGDFASIRSGESVKEAVKLVCQSNATGIMFNCSVPEVMDQAIIDTKQVMDELGQDLEIGVYANNFAPISSEHEANDMLQEMRELDGQGYLAYAKRWHELGANIVGGCCGIGPKHIQALADWKRSTQS
ncbi:homocysteine S-methyltransferase family protein [Vibrio sp. 070316B]|uniref:homocysteine S-methyltransferase family protein n=1 Tax=Vibrio TaxID=662 RepID=UPI001493CB6A|nr:MULTISPECIES: homocysteine S-methyltransferase family protein [unclassified Vibrio]CAH6851913.1 Homocysteine methyltransferase [Vibrio chagasii]NOI39830.1 homocysteine S-methyltransferase family protein [Vibrio sp. 070316B]NOI84640.1 homocysteine S-methyltransferase family protein [Vibrio sp. 99K-1]CAH6852407.1 Homocysteine methyltransferase [Vibrio chagasii]CAH6863156.1 Homocysteine methyltransferase [Vibrio chagasii]